VTVSACAGVARKVASTRISFFTEHLLPPSTPRQLQLAAFVAACPKNAAQDFHYFFGQTISRSRKGSDCDFRLPLRGVNHAEWPLTRQLFDSACKISHVSPRVVLESNTAQALLALVKAEQGIAILPSTVRLDKIRQKVIPIRHNQRPIQLWMSAIWDPRRYLAPAAKIFIEEAYRFTMRDYPGRHLGIRGPAGQRQRPIATVC